MQSKGKEFKGNLTNESLGKQFKSQFELVNYAIKLAENMIKSGHESSLFADNHNTALHVVADIAAGKVVLEDILEVHLDINAQPLSINGQLTVEEEVEKPVEKAPAKKAKATKSKKS